MSNEKAAYTQLSKKERSRLARERRKEESAKDEASAGVTMNGNKTSPFEGTTTFESACTGMATTKVIIIHVVLLFVLLYSPPLSQSQSLSQIKYDSCIGDEQWH